MRTTQSRGAFAEQDYAGLNIFLLCFVERVPPFGKFVGELDFPRYRLNIP